MEKKSAVASVDQMRQSYEEGSLSIDDVGVCPIDFFKNWFEQARQAEHPEWLEINAMTLSTVAADPSPDSRIVLLKGVEDGRFRFFSNYDSDKGRQIESNDRVALCFHWPHLQRQVRILGNAQKSAREITENYFQTRPRGSQLGALVSNQSQQTTLEELQQKMADLEAKYAEQKVPCPAHWGGYDVEPTRIEFWQGRPSRLHDRIVFKLSGDSSWVIERLSP
ncbi:MAG: pyridoxamine 5'-phosphate oxidase [Planctomycetota bacterium]